MVIVDQSSSSKGGRTNGGADMKIPRCVHKAYMGATKVLQTLKADKVSCTQVQDLVREKKKINNPYLKNKLSQNTNKDMATYEQMQKPIFGGTWPSDEQWVCNALPNKGSNTRFWLQNPNGISTYDNFRTFRGDLEEMKEKEIDFVGIPETKLNHSNKLVCERFNNVLESHLPNVRSSITNTRGFSSEIQYQPGGVASLAMNKLAGRYAGQGHDPLGRYNWMKFCGKRRTLKIYTFYRVVQNGGQNVGDTTAYAQQYNALNSSVQKEYQENDETCEGKKKKEKKHVIINPRENILQCLQQDVLKDIKKNELVIVMGDLNENIFSAKFNTTMSDMGMVNVLQDVYENLTDKVRSQNRGKNVIDGIWMSAPLTDMNKSVGMAPFYELFTSDHRGIYVDLSLKEILDAPDIEFRQLQFRRLQASIPKRTKAYIDHLTKQWAIRNMSEKINHVKAVQHTIRSEELEQLLNNLDVQMGEMMTSAEKKCTNISKNAIHAWSPTLGDAIKKERTIKKKIAKIRRCGVCENMKDINSRLMHLNHELKESRKEIKNAKVDADSLRKTHLEELIQEKLDKNPKSTYAGELKKLQNVEKQRSDARRICNSHQRSRREGIKSIYIPASVEYDNECDRNQYRNMDVMWKRLQLQNGKDIKEWEKIEDRNLVEKLTLQCMKIGRASCRERV